MSTPTPTSLPQQHGLAARMGRWSATHWKTATFGWLAFVVVAFALGGLVGTKNVDSNAGPGESGRMQKILDAGFKQPAGESVLIESRSARVGDPRLHGGDQRRDRRRLETHRGAAGPPRSDLQEPTRCARRLSDPR